MRSIIPVITIFAVACGPVDTSDSLNEVGASALSTDAERNGVLAVVNDPVVDFTVLDIDVGLDRRAARRIEEYRNGNDGRAGTADDDLFDSIEELDSVPYVGKSALQKLLKYADAQGYLQTSPIDAFSREQAILAVVNDPAINFVKLDRDVGLDRRAARNIIDYREGPDGREGTRDDNPIDTIAELDAIKYVGDKALEQLFQYGLANGYITVGSAAVSEAIFSPQAYADSHNVRVAQIIDGAQVSLDIAMYSFSDARISDAIEAAVNRGVKVRFVFETANQDRKLDPSDRWNTKSGRLEAIGVNVRYVNKIMHHKYLIADGPRDDLSMASSARLVTGSGNWSFGAATRYDENTLFLTGHTELALRLQQEFNLMWEHSRDFESVALPHEFSSVEITAADITDDPNTEVYFTSDNFSVSGTTFRVNGLNTVSDALVAAIEGATDSIWVASGHMRSRPVAEALIAKAAASPQMDIRVYLDGQEYISAWYNGEQQRNLQDCLAAATTDSRRRRCMERGYYFGYDIGQAGIDVRYKYYSYRWHYSYADQMHHKLMIIDGDELWTGSYNLSDNAERNTFENMFMFRGPENAGLVSQYVANFESIWDTGRFGSLWDDLLDSVENDDNIPLVFDSMALDYNEVRIIKNEIRANCPQINDAQYREEPEKHRFCARN